MNRKKILWTLLMLLILFTTGLVFNLSRKDYIKKNKDMVRDVLNLAGEIQDRSLHLNSLIQQVDININGELLSGFPFQPFQKKLNHLVLSLQDTSSSARKEKLKESLLMLRKALVSYEFALKRTKNRQYREAKTQIRFVRFYLEEARKKVKKPATLPFVNPFRRS
jgi:hypothetical protein